MSHKFDRHWPDLFVCVLRSSSLASASRKRRRINSPTSLHNIYIRRIYKLRKVKGTLFNSSILQLPWRNVFVRDQG
ncbi:hypothetical protein AAZX31_14G004900 [Glycine max]